jgi:hypothetical protein
VVPVGERNRRELVAMGMQVLALLPEAPTPVATQPAVLDTFLARLRDG